MIRRRFLQALAALPFFNKNFQSVPSTNNWWNSAWQIVSEPFTGAWQRNVIAQPAQNLLQNSAVYACVTGIASDIAKLRIKLMRNQANIWKEVTENSPYLGVLEKPNRYQTRFKFLEQWIVSKLLYGNAYILKERESVRGLVRALYVLHPNCVKPLVTDDGQVYYEIHRDYLSGVPDIITVPASEIIHDMMVSLWHPLVGVSPIFACAMSATLGNSITENSANLFTNRAQPGGMLTFPGKISDGTAARAKAYFEQNYSGSKIGGIFVASDGAKFEQFSMTAVDAQLTQQLRWTVEDIARAFRYPMFKLGGPMPPYSSGPHVLEQLYYTDCLQPYIESIEECLNNGLELKRELGTELDIDNLLRMDPSALAEANNKGVGGGWLSPNEARFRANLAPVDGGESPLMQQQNWQLSQLAERSAPVDSASVAPPSNQIPESVPEKGLEPALTELVSQAEFRKELACA